MPGMIIPTAKDSRTVAAASKQLNKKGSSCLYGFTNTETSTKMSVSGRTVFSFEGILHASTDDISCSCGARMHVNNHREAMLRHLPFGGYLSCVRFEHSQYVCPKCGKTRMQHISFKAPGHRITEELLQYTCDLLASGNYTSQIPRSKLTGHENS
nr:hypothetical protein [uncultured Merdimonas sp.]